MKEPLRAALVGCGSVAQRGLLPHLTLDDSSVRLELVALCDTVVSRAAQVAERFRVKEWFADYKDLLAQVEIDLLLITTPVSTHFNIAMAAIEAGVHVYIQKPITSTVAEADKLIVASKKQNVKLVGAPGQMLSPGLQHLKKLISEESIGRFYWAFSNTAFIGPEHETFRETEPVDPTWYYKKPGGGPVNSMAVYSLHTLTGVIGPAQRVTAMSGVRLPQRSFQGRKIDVEMDDNTLMLLDFGAARFAVIGAQYAQTGKVVNWGFTGFYGSSGALEITSRLLDTGYPGQINVNPPDLEEYLGFPHPDYTVAALPYISGSHLDIPELHVYADVCHLAECVLQDTDPIASAEHARHVLEIIEKAYLAARSGLTQQIHTEF